MLYFQTFTAFLGVCCFVHVQELERVSKGEES